MSAEPATSDAGGVGSGRPRRLTALLVIAALIGAAAAFATYRSIGGHDGGAARAIANAATVAEAQRLIGLDVEPALQADLGSGLVGAVLVAVYALAYWPTIAGACALTLWRDRVTARRLAWAIAGSGLVGLAVMSLFPLAPPRLVGALDDQMAGSSLSPLAHPSGWFNPHAAMPSFHVCWTALAAAAARQVVGPAALALPIVMSLAVVTTGNHWTVDVAAGWLLAAIAWLSAPHLDRHALEACRRGQSRTRR